MTAAELKSSPKVTRLEDGGALVFLAPTEGNGDLEWLEANDSATADDPWDEFKWRAAISAPETQARTVIAAVLVDLPDGRVWCYQAGYGVIVADQGEWFLRRLVVLPRYQRRGIGRALLAKLGEYAGGSRFATLIPDRKRSDGSIAFFKAAGWVGAQAPDGYYEFRAPTGPEQRLVFL